MSTFWHCTSSRGWLPLVLLLLVSNLAPLAAAGLAFQQYPIDWSLVPDAPDAAINISTSCICALLNGTCTPNCCCDPACPSALVDGYKKAGHCLPEGPPPDQLSYCLPQEPFAKVNLPSGDYYHLEKQAAGNDFFTQLLCVTGDHNPSLGESYPDPPAGDVGSNAQEAACQATTATSSTSTSSSTSYAYGQTLHVIGGIPPAAAGVKIRGLFVVPVGVLSAECLDLQQVGFMARLPGSLRAQTSKCQRTFSSTTVLNNMCNDAVSPMSATYWAGLQFPPSPVSQQHKSVELTSVVKRDLTTGAITKLDPDIDLAAPVAAAGPPVACSGVVIEARFTFRTVVDPDIGAPLISAVQLSLVVADVAMPSSGVPLVVDTAFSINWANASIPSNALQPFSGAPGYLPGFPLLAGVEASAPAAADPSATRHAVSRLVDGLHLPGPGPAGRCSPSPAYAPVVSFGYNLSSSCGIALTLAQLRTLCTANNPAKSLTDIMGSTWLSNLTSQQVLLGIWGNADPSNIHHWLPLVSTGWPPSTDLVWDEPTSTCHNMAVGMQVQLLTGVAFSAGNLQSKLLYASACFTYGSWTFDRLNGPSLQSFPLQFGVQFVPKANQQPVLSLKPAPPLFKPLPPDLLYPFMTSSGGRRQVPGTLQAWLAVAATMWVGWHMQP